MSTIPRTRKTVMKTQDHAALTSVTYFLNRTLSVPVEICDTSPRYTHKPGAALRDGFTFTTPLCTLYLGIS